MARFIFSYHLFFFGSKIKKKSTFGSNKMQWPKIEGMADIFFFAKNMPDMKYPVCVIYPQLWWNHCTPVPPRLLWMLLQPLLDLQHCQWHGQEWIPLLLARPHLPLHPCHPPQETSKREIWYWGWFPIVLSQIANPPHPRVMMVLIVQLLSSAQPVWPVRQLQRWRRGGTSHNKTPHKSNILNLSSI